MSIKNEEVINETTQPEEMITANQPQNESLDDLAVENDSEVKGGPGVSGGGIYVNHNETFADDQDVDDCTIIYLNAAVRDLPATELAAGEVRGGIAKPAETMPALRPPPPQLPPDPPKPILL